MRGRGPGTDDECVRLGARARTCGCRRGGSVSAVSGWQVLAPLLLASAWAVLVLVAEMFSARRYTGVAWLCVVGLAAVAIAALTGQTGVAYGRALSIDAFTV